MSTVPTAAEGLLGRLEQFADRRRDTLHVLWSVLAAAIMIPPGLSILGSIELARGWYLTAVGCCVLLHLAYAVRRRPAIAYGLGAGAMAVLVAVPNGLVPAGADGALVEAPTVLLPSALIFPLLLYGVARHLSARANRWALGTAAVGVVLVTLRVVSVADSGVVTARWLPVFAAVSLVAVVVAAWSTGQVQRIRAARAVSDRERAAREAVAEERRRIVREMHDVVSHSLAVIVRQADGAGYAAAKQPDVAVRTLHAIAATGREALRDMRGLLGVVGSDGSGAPQPRLEELPTLYERMRAAGLDVREEVTGTGALSPAGELAVYRLVQEALTNVLKHGGPTAVAEVGLRWSADELVVEVRDTGGAGAAPGAADAGLPGSGSGLRGIAERIEALGGELVTGPVPPSGFVVRATVPYAAQEGR